MREKLVTVNAPCISLLVVALLFFSLVPSLSSSLRRAEASPPTSISPTPADAGGLHTIVTPGSAPTNLCSGNCVITGGTRPGGGANLFHSFGQFNVGSGDITTFQNGISFDVNGNPLAAGLPTSNILARITGTNGNNPSLSTIYGTIQTAADFGSANLFLINPAGFLFGPNATVNVGGMMTFTTANSIQLTDGGRFNANPNAMPADFLIAAPVAAFGFIGSNPAAIDFIGGQLTIARGTGLALVGGDISLMPDSSDMPSSVTAPGRPILLTSVAGPGSVAADTMVPTPGMALGTITLGQGSSVSTAGDSSFGDGSGGSISIRGGQFVATGPTMITSPYEDPVSFSSTGSGGDITVNVTGTGTITDSLIQTNSLDAGNAGTLFLAAKTGLTLTNSIIDSTSTSSTGKVSAINHHSGTVGALSNGGAVTLTTEEGTLTMTDSFISTVTSNAGNAGAVTITGKNVTFDRSGVFTDALPIDFDVTRTPALRQVHPGEVTVTAENTVTFSGSFSGDPGVPVISATALGTLVDAGRVTITGRTVNLSDGMVDASIHNGAIVSPGKGGTIEIRGNNLNLTQFQLISEADGLPKSTGTGGDILLRGANNIYADKIQLTASQVNANATSGGGAGNVTLQSKVLRVSDHTEVATGSFGQGSGGTITVKGAEEVTIESGSRMITDVIVSLAGVPQGTAGNILIETQNLMLQGGGQIDAVARPLSSGNAANITVHGTNGPAQSVQINGPGSGIFTDTQGTGAGGNIFVDANSVTLQNGGTLSAKTSGTEATAIGGTISVTATNQVTMTGSASITTSSTGPGNAGSIKINAGQQLDMRDSSIKTEASQASGGNIDIQAVDHVRLVNSTITTSVLGGSGSGGNITIDPNVVVLQNSQILAQAVQGAGGNITITTPLFLADQTSLVSASSQFGLNGTVTIQNPTSNLSESLGPLPSSMLEQQALQAQRCAALHGGASSSFIIAGRDTVPTEPGGWLASSLGLHSLGRGLLADTMIDEQPPTTLVMAEASESISLRRLTPIGFLTQRFAGNGSDGCRS